MVSLIYLTSDSHDDSHLCNSAAGPVDDYHLVYTQVVATIITSLWQLIESASVANLSTVIYSAERGYEGITVSLDEGTLARESPTWTELDF